ncbi:prolyl aminopeptidase [Alteromonas lipolytica]|uniref:Proline iminopeptidase n=1 Tax=Alteromonas lipolytica TaxID=1856405 RepID=A0A1E8F8U7_9ALTE|nr:prolyl aminopeptidase [Alteromonas lipolytica]OFI32330.1 prolyl aminopeptidase [Alteromonas lipolytica]GGF85390.1 proline iminopeptidase [Alteromonas lipolytica]
MPPTCYLHDYMPTHDGHQIYYELSGNPKGIPVLVIHGGPGAGLSPGYTDFFDLDSYHVIGFEQRGCGRSQPHLSLDNNTTHHLLDDISQLRTTLGIKQWLLFGGSWGTTLALLAAIREPETVSGMILRGIFLARQTDFHWFLAPDGGAARIYPDAFARFTETMSTQGDLSEVLAHYSAIFSGHQQSLKAVAAIRWYQWEEAIARVFPHSSEPTSLTCSPLLMSLAVLEWHYIINDCFISEDYILQNVHQLRSIPAKLIHGRCDTVCQPQGAYLLHQHWPNSDLLLVEGAGHSSADFGIASALRQATNDFKAMY